MNRRGFLRGLLSAFVAGPSTARALLRGTAISSVTITSMGSGYTSAPLVATNPYWVQRRAFDPKLFVQLWQEEFASEHDH